MEWLYDRVCRHCGETFRTPWRFKCYCTDRCWVAAHPYKPPKHPHWTPAEIQAMRDLAGKLSPREIAERIGRSLDSVKCKANDLGISLRLYGDHHPQTKYSDAVVEQARTLHDEGVKPKDIARRLGMPIGRARKYVYYRERLGPPVEYYFQ